MMRLHMRSSIAIRGARALRWFGIELTLINITLQQRRRSQWGQHVLPQNQLKWFNKFDRTDWNSLPVSILSIEFRNDSPMYFKFLGPIFCQFSSQKMLMCPKTASDFWNFFGEVSHSFRLFLPMDTAGLTWHDFDFINSINLVRPNDMKQKKIAKSKKRLDMHGLRDKLDECDCNHSLRCWL